MGKKKIVTISLISIIIIILILGYIFIRTNLTMKAIIIKCYENSILVYEEKSEELTQIVLPENIKLKFKPGQEVRIYLAHNTWVTDSYPGSIDSMFIKKIKIIKEDGNTQIVERILGQGFFKEENH